MFPYSVYICNQKWVSTIAVASKLFVIAYRLEVPYSRRVPPGSKETQLNQISPYLHYRTSNVHKSTEHNSMRGFYLFLLRQLVNAGNDFAHSTLVAMPGRNKTVPVFLI